MSVPPTPFPTPGQPPNWGQQLIDAIVDRLGLTNDEVDALRVLVDSGRLSPAALAAAFADKGAVDALQDLTSTGRLSEASLMSTIAMDVDGKLAQVFTVSRNLIDMDTIHLGTVLNPDGTLRTDVSTRWTTDFTPVEPNTTYVISHDGTPITGSDVVLQRYAADGSTIGNMSNGGSDGTFATTSLTTHVRLSFFNEFMDAAQVEKGTVPTPYMPKGAREVIGVDDKIDERVPAAVEEYLTEHPPSGGGFVEDPDHPGYYLIGD